MQAGQPAVHGQTSCVECGRVLAVMFVSSYEFDVKLLEINEFGGNAAS